MRSEPVFSNVVLLIVQHASGESHNKLCFCGIGEECFEERTAPRVLGMVDISQDSILFPTFTVLPEDHNFAMAAYLTPIEPDTSKFQLHCHHIRISENSVERSWVVEDFTAVTGEYLDAHNNLCFNSAGDILFTSSYTAPSALAVMRAFDVRSGREISNRNIDQSNLYLDAIYLHPHPYESRTVLLSVAHHQSESEVEVWALDGPARLDDSTQEWRWEKTMALMNRAVLGFDPSGASGMAGYFHDLTPVDVRTMLQHEYDEVDIGACVFGDVSDEEEDDDRYHLQSFSFFWLSARCVLFEMEVGDTIERLAMKWCAPQDGEWEAHAMRIDSSSRMPVHSSGRVLSTNAFDALTLFDQDTIEIESSSSSLPAGLSDELWLEILCMLDVPTICRCAQLNRLMYHLCTDSSLWVTLRCKQLGIERLSLPARVEGSNWRTMAFARNACVLHHHCQNVKARYALHCAINSRVASTRVQFYDLCREGCAVDNGPWRRLTLY